MPLTVGLGHGGMGAVYRARDTRLNISVAVKEMRPDPNADVHTLSQLRRQFEHEAQVVAGLDHPNLVRVTDYFSWGASWSPDGRRLAFSSDRDGDNGIYVMDADGGNVIQLTYNEARDTWPVWSPNPWLSEMRMVACASICAPGPD